jgi:uncharacterized protein YprB with RNaseH-like and TPR domain
VLRNTFLHLPNIGRKTEKALWAQGCEDWDCLIEGIDRFSVGTADRIEVLDALHQSRTCLDRGEHQYFARCLGQAEAWRAYPEFKHSCVYLDIETDGGMGETSITTIGLFDGKEFRCLVKGRDIECFRDIISHYSMIVTFFGHGFDIPVLLRRFPGLRLDQIHLDLCPALRKVGYKGGLKSIEKQFGIERSPETEGLTGLDAVKLWRSYLRMGNEDALERLIAYNREDCVNMLPLAEAAYKRLRRDTLHIEPALPV